MLFLSEEMTFPFGPEGREGRSHSKSGRESTSQAETKACANVGSTKALNEPIEMKGAHCGWGMVIWGEHKMNWRRRQMLGHTEGLDFIACSMGGFEPRNHLVSM